jgi:putative transposase
LQCASDKTHISTHTKGFEVPPRRWVVERAFAWILRNRRLVRDYEQLVAVAEILIIIAASDTTLRRWG